MTQQPGRSGQDLISDFQRWLVRSSARRAGREVGGQIRSVLGRSNGSADVWEQATAPPTDEAPECAWCPVCRAARIFREQGPGMSSQVTAATEAMGTLARDALSVFESALAATSKVAKQGTEGGQGGGGGQAPSASVWANVTERDAAERPGPAGPADGPGPAGPVDVTEQDAAERPGPAGPADEPEPAGPVDVTERDAAERPGPAGPADGPGPAGPVDVTEGDAAERPGPAGPADEPEPSGSPAEPPHEPDDRG